MINGTNNPFSCSPVVFSASNTIISLGTISRVGNVFTFSVGFVWRINGTIYQNSAPISLTITEAADGFKRIDNAILNASNSIELQQGLESSAVALQPIVPETNILLTSWNIYGDAIDDQLTPNVGNNFLQKEYEKSQVVNTSGNAVVIPLNIKGRNNIILNGALTGVVGFSLTNLNANPANAEYPHEGKDYYIQNKTGHAVTLKNFDTTVDIPFLSKDGNDIVVPNNGIVFFKNSSNVLQEIFRSWENKNASISNTTTYTSAPTTANQILSILEIPANTFANDDIINFKALFTKLTGLANCNITIWKNTTQSLTGASIFYKPYDIIYLFLKIITYDHKIGVFKNNTLIISNQKGGGDSYNYIDADYNVVDFEINFNPSEKNYLIVTCELNNANDVIKQEAILIEKIN